LYIAEDVLSDSTVGTTDGAAGGNGTGRHSRVVDSVIFNLQLVINRFAALGFLVVLVRMMMMVVVEVHGRDDDWMW